jgi:hypothetical protein
MNEFDFYNSRVERRVREWGERDRDGKNDNKWREISGYYFIYSFSYLFRCFFHGNWLKWNRKLGSYFLFARDKKTRFVFQRWKKLKKKKFW